MAGGTAAKRIRRHVATILEAIDVSSASEYTEPGPAFWSCASIGRLEEVSTDAPRSATRAFEVTHGAYAPPDQSFGLESAGAFDALLIRVLYCSEQSGAGLESRRDLMAADRVAIGHAITRPEVHGVDSWPVAVPEIRGWPQVVSIAAPLELSPETDILEIEIQFAYQVGP